LLVWETLPWHPYCVKPPWHLQCWITYFVDCRESGNYPEMGAGDLSTNTGKPQLISPNGTSGSQGGSIRPVAALSDIAYLGA